MAEVVSSACLVSGRFESAKIEHQGSDTVKLYFKEWIWKLCVIKRGFKCFR
jgi:hypothetical protein